MPDATSRLHSESIMSPGTGDDRPPSISHSLTLLTSTAIRPCPFLLREYGRLWARKLVRPLAHLAAVAQQVVGQHASHHGLAYRHGADADTGIVAALGHDLGLAALAVDGAARREDRGRRLHRKAHH